MPPHSPLFPLDGIRDNAVTAGGLALDRRFPCPYSTKNCKDAPPKIRRNQTIGKNRYKWRWKITIVAKFIGRIPQRLLVRVTGRWEGRVVEGCSTPWSWRQKRLWNEVSMSWVWGEVTILVLTGSAKIRLHLTCSFIENRSFSQISEKTYRQKHDMFIL